MGFGHRVYKNFDPRAKIIKKACEEVFEVTGKNPLLAGSGREVRSRSRTARRPACGGDGGRHGHTIARGAEIQHPPSAGLTRRRR